VIARYYADSIFAKNNVFGRPVSAAPIVFKTSSEHRRQKALPFA
jgi:hypothetical protein